jgi:hypothetical protein
MTAEEKNEERGIHRLEHSRFQISSNLSFSLLLTVPADLPVGQISRQLRTQKPDG